MSKRISPYLTVFIILLFAGAAVYYVFFFQSEPQFDIRKFSGNVIAVEGNKITLHGVFSGPATLFGDLASARDFSFKADEATKFRKVDIRWPTWEELAAQGTSGTFKIQNLPRTEEEGSLDDLEKLFLSLSLSDDEGEGRAIYVEADFPASIYNSKNPAASSILYQIMGIPPPTGLPQTPNP